MPSNRTIEDESFLKAMGTAYPTDPHASCKARLAEEQARTDAEQATARQAWKVVDEIRASRDWWHESFWWAAGMAGVFAVVMIVVAIVK